MNGRTFIEVLALKEPAGRFSFVQGIENNSGIWVGLDENTWSTSGSRFGCYITHNSFDGDVSTSTAAAIRVFVMDSLTPDLLLPDAMTCRVDGANMTMRVAAANGGSKVLSGLGSANITRVGPWPTGSANVAELLVYDRALSRLELETVEAALSMRYGVKLTK